MPLLFGNTIACTSGDAKISQVHVTAMRERKRPTIDRPLGNRSVHSYYRPLNGMRVRVAPQTHRKRQQDHP